MVGNGGTPRFGLAAGYGKLDGFSSLPGKFPPLHSSGGFWRGLQLAGGKLSTGKMGKKIYFTGMSCWYLGSIDYFTLNISRARLHPVNR